MRALRIAWTAFFVLGLIRSYLGILAAALHPEYLSHVNAGGVSLASQIAACAALALVALVVFGGHPVRLAWAAVWAVGAGEFASASLILAGWPAPSLRLGLWLLVPGAVLLPSLAASRPALARHLDHVSLTAAAASMLLLVALVVALNLESAGPGLRLGVWSALAAGAGCSALALLRRPPRHV